MGVDIKAGSMEIEVNHKLEGTKVLDALKEVWSNGDLSLGAKMEMYEGIDMPENYIVARADSHHAEISGTYVPYLMYVIIVIITIIIVNMFLTLFFF